MGHGDGDDGSCSAVSSEICVELILLSDNISVTAKEINSTIFAFFVAIAVHYVELLLSN